MKIERNQIRISGQISSADLFKNLKQGSPLSVTIAERSGQRHAVLDIGGKRVNAEFLQGIPCSGKLSLILDREINGTFFFRIADSAHKEEVIRELYKFTVFNNDLNKPIHKLRLHLKEGINSIFALNKALAGFNKDNTTDKIINLFNRLLSKGAEYENLMHIAALIYGGRGAPARQFHYILSQIFPNYKYLFNINKNKITGEIINFCDLIEGYFAEDDKGEGIRNIMDFIANYPEKDADSYGEIIFFDENKFKPCRYIIDKNNMLLSLNLSYLGDIDILIKLEKSYHSIAFYSEKDESLAALKSEIGKLESSLSLYNKNKFHIIFYNRKKAIEKIIEIISFIELNYLLDVKA